MTIGRLRARESHDQADAGDGRTSDSVLSLLKRRAWQAGYFVGRHEVFYPSPGKGDLYVMPRRSDPSDKTEWTPSVLKYSTARKVERFLADQEEKLC